MTARPRQGKAPPLPSRAALRALAAADPALGDVMTRAEPYPGFPLPADRRLTHYDALARAIVHQQLSGKAAATIHRRACALTPGSRFPRPAEVLSLPDRAVRAAGMSRGKLLALRDLAARVQDGRLRLPAIGRLADDEVIARLVEVRGIGVWSAQMFLMFRLGRLDVMPSGDLGVREGLRLLDGLAERPSPRSVEERGEAWRPLRSVAAWFLWRRVELERSGNG